MKRLEILGLAVLLAAGHLSSGPGTKERQRKIPQIKAVTAELHPVRFQPISPISAQLERPWADEFPFSLDSENPTTYHDFTTETKGRITAEVRVLSGGDIRALLIPPGENAEPAAVEEGQGVLQLNADIRPELMREGNKWTLLIQAASVSPPGKKIIRPLTAKLAPEFPIRGTFRVTFPMALQLRPSPFLPAVIEEMNKVLDGRPSAEWRPLQAHREMLRKVVSLYEQIPIQVKQQLYAGPYLAVGSDSEAARRSKALDVQVSLSLPPRAAQKPNPPPEFTSYYPASPTPGSWVMFSGENLEHPERETQVILAKTVPGAMGRFVSLKEGENLRVTNRSIAFQIPSGAEWTGRFNLVVMNPWGREEVGFNVYPTEYQAQRYTGKIVSVTCQDESNPESPNWLVGSDEVYALINVLQVAGAESSDWGVKTSTKGGFDDGEEKAVDWPFFDQYGRPLPIRDGCVIMVSLVEDDPGGSPAGLHSLMRSTVQGVVRNLAFSGGELGGVPMSSLLAEITMNLIGAIWDLINNALRDDPLGTQAVHFSSWDLHQATQGRNFVVRRLTYSNNGSTGSYVADLRIDRR